METPFCRTEKMFGEAAMRVFFGARVAVFGAGGVGGYTIEALAVRESARWTSLTATP